MDMERYWQEEYERRALEKRSDHEITGYSLYGHTRRLNAVKCFYDTLRYQNKEFQRVLDLGCGPGSYLNQIFRGEGSRSRFGLDFSLNVLRFAKSKYQLKNLVCANSKYLPFREQSMDLIYSVGMIQQLKDPEMVFKSVFPVLRKGGVFFIITMSDTFKIRPLYKVRGFGRDHNPLKPSLLESMLKAVGFRAVKISPLVLLPRGLRAFHFLQNIKLLFPLIKPIVHDLVVIAKK